MWVNYNTCSTWFLNIRVYQLVYGAPICNNTVLLYNLNTNSVKAITFCVTRLKHFPQNFGHHSFQDHLYIVKCVGRYLKYYSIAII